MILLALGSNLPFCGAQPSEILVLAIRAIDRIAPVARVSRFYSSPAWPDPSDPEFVNAALSVSNAPPPEEFLMRLHEIERTFGRRRNRPNGPRTLDIDLLAYGDEIRREGAPILPHPGLMRRDFVLAPLADIAPDWRPPGARATVSALLASLKVMTAEPISP
ncbi:MAG: 2-amino-4-hydroxy-6-hydroxymethyldihydropteridine diphosphokinase [Parvularculaceae bacterium]